MKKYFLTFFSILFFAAPFLNAQTIIPDPKFEQVLIDLGIDTDGIINQSVATDDIKGITSLDVSNKMIESLTGIEGFTSLKTLLCGSNLLTELEIDTNIALEILDCSNNQIKNLNLINPLNDELNNPLLKTLVCSKNQLSSIDISKNTTLTLVGISNNQIAGELVVNNNLNLENLFCASNQITKLDLSNNNLLKNLDASNNLISELDLSGMNTVVCPATICQSNSSSINVSGNQLTALKINNGFNNLFARFDSRDNLQLFCIQTDVEFTPPGQINGWFKDNWTYYSDTDCTENLFTYVPDDNFEAYLESQGLGDGIEDNNFVLTDRVSNITTLNIASLGIKNIKGVEAFIALTTLDCSGNYLSNLKLKSNLALENLNCASQIPYIDLIKSSNNYTFNKLDVSANVNLKTLDCSGNADISSLNLTNNNLLETLNCSNNNLTSLDLTPNIALTTLDCSFNSLAILYLNTNASLKILNCSDNNLTSLNLNTNKALTSLICSSNQMASMDLTANTNLVTLNCSDNELLDLDLSFNTALTDINVSNNALISLNVKNGANPAITVFNATGNTVLICIQIDDLFTATTEADGWFKETTASFNGSCDLTYVPDVNFEDYLETHDAAGTVVTLGDATSMGDGFMNNFVPTNIINTITDLDVSNLGIIDLTGIEDFIALQTLNCSGNNLALLNLSTNVALETLDCSGNSLTILNLKTNISLTSLICSSNQIVSLDLSANTNLVTFNCVNNKLLDLDLSFNAALTDINVSNNALISLNIKNGANPAITAFDATGNTVLICIQIDDLFTATTEADGWFKETTATYNGSCDLTYVPDDNFEDYLETHDAAGTVVNLGDATSMGDGLMNNFVPTNIINTITYLNVSNLVIGDLTGIEDFIALQTLNCTGNNLPLLNLSTNVALDTLDCSSNSLTSLDLNTNAALTTLNCSVNQIVSLDLRVNTNLVTLNCSDNKLLDLDLSFNAVLTDINVSNNELISLNVKNTANGNITAFDARVNTVLICIQIDDLFTATTEADGWFKDSLASYNENCSARQTDIADPNFEQALIDLGYDDVLDNKIATANIERLLFLDVIDKNIFDLTGIQDFVLLDTLKVTDNKLTILDISANRNLKGLYCDGNFLSELLLTNNTSLVKLKCGDNQLNTLDLQNNLALEELFCNNNNLTSLNFSGLVNLEVLNFNSNYITNLGSSIIDLATLFELKELYCASNNLSSLDIENNDKLEKLDCSDNNLIFLDTYTNSLLQVLNCSNNLLPELDINSNTVIEELNCNSNLITSLTSDSNIDYNSLIKLTCDDNKLGTLQVTKFPELTVLSCQSNLLTELILTSNSALDTLDFSKNNISTINFLNNTKLTSLKGSQNKLTNTLNLSTNGLLKTINVNNNQISVIQFAANPIIKYLYCATNKLTSLNVNDHLDLVELNVSSNLLESLTLSDNLGTLKTFNASNNKLVEIDLSTMGTTACPPPPVDPEIQPELCPITLTINVSKNQLTSLYINNGINANISSFNATQNPSLSCIQIDAGFTPPTVTSSGWQKDSAASYSENCHFQETYVPDVNFEQVLIDNYGITDPTIDGYILTSEINTLPVLDISNQSISDLTGIEDFIALTALNCSTNLLNNLNVNRNVALTNIDCSNNTLSSLDFSKNTALITVDCSNNTLSTIDLTANTKLNILNISNNLFSEFNASTIESLEEFNCDSNQLINLDFQLNKFLIDLSCASNQLQTLNIKNGYNSSLGAVDATNNPDLTCITADVETIPVGADWQIGSASLSFDCHYFQTYIPDNGFEQALIALGYDVLLDDYVLTDNISGLTSLNISDKGISVLTGLEGFESLVTLNCSKNQLTAFNITNELIENLNCSENPITTIDITTLTNLKTFNVSNTGISSLDLSANLNLVNLNISKTPLETLESLNTCLDLEIIDFSSTLLNEIDLSANTLLTYIKGQSNSLLYKIKVKNGVNQNISNFDVIYSPKLRCIEVDDPYATFLNNWRKDGTAYFKFLCDTVDDDNDGIADAEDDCLGTPFDTPVDLFGCPYFSLPYDNFTVMITGETCLSSNNGKVNITAIETYNYTATITGPAYSNTYKFTNEVEIRNLRQGTYQICITVDVDPAYRNCYDVVISEPEPLAVLTNKSTKGQKVSLDMSGSSNYNIDLNGFKFSTTDSTIDLSLKNGSNSIKVSTDLDCQGIYEEEIFMSDGLFVYPNPFEDKINIYLGASESEKTEINIYSYLGQLVYSKSLTKHQDYLTIDTNDLTMGLYIVSVKTNESLSTFKIVKK